MRLWHRRFSFIRLPGFNASGVHGLYNEANFPNQFISWYNTYGISANLIKNLGAHSLKFGTELRLMDQSSVNYGSAPPAARTPIRRASPGTSGLRS